MLLRIPDFLTGWILFPLFLGGIYHADPVSNDEALLPPAHIRTLSRQLRVDLIWDAVKEPVTYEIRRSEKPDDDFILLLVQLTNFDVNVYSDFMGQGDRRFYYQIRSVRHGITA